MASVPPHPAFPFPSHSVLHSLESYLLYASMFSNCHCNLVYQIESLPGKNGKENGQGHHNCHLIFLIIQEL